MFYGYIVLMSSILVLLESKTKIKEIKYFSNVILVLVVFSMIIIGGFREDVGFDTSTYTRMFEGMPKISSDFIESTQHRHGEIGFKFLIGILKTMGFEHVQSLFIIIIVTSLILNLNSFKKYTPYYLISIYLYICLYFFGREMGQIRQALSTAVCFFSIRYIKERNLFKFLISILLATSFHTSSIIMLPFYFIGSKDFKKSTYIVFLLIGILLYNIDWLRPNIHIIEKIFSFELPYINTEYGQPIDTLLSLQYLRRLFPAILIIFSCNKLQSKHEYFKIASNLQFGGVFLSLIFHEVKIYVERLFVPLIFTEILIYGFFMDYFKDKYLRFLYKIFLIGFGILYFLNLMISKSHVFFPYKNLLFNLF